MGLRDGLVLKDGRWVGFATWQMSLILREALGLCNGKWVRLPRLAGLCEMDWGDSFGRCEMGWVCEMGEGFALQNGRWVGFANKWAMFWEVG